MPVSMPDFWRLVDESGLLETPQVQRLKQDFAQVGGGDPANTKALAEWLVANKVLSRYQTTILLAGRSGPFFYGDYRVYDRLSLGSLAGMFRATHSATGHPVLLHFLTGPDSEDPQRWLRIARRALQESSFVHRHLHRCFEPVDLGNFKFLVFDDLRGQSLAERIEQGKLPPSEAAHVVRLAAMGLMFLHQNREVHGDLRTGNLWLFEQGNVKLLRSPARRLEGAVLERVDSKQANYLAPEFLDREKQPDLQTDIYALGCILYEALAGRPPFDGGDVSNKMQRHASEAIAPLESHGVPQPLAQTVAYMMAKNPQVRFRELAPIIEQLGHFLEAPQRSWQPPSPATTLPAFESRIREKHVHLKRQLAQSPTPTQSSAPAAARGVSAGSVGQATAPAVNIDAGPGGIGRVGTASRSGKPAVVAGTTSSASPTLAHRDPAGPGKNNTRTLALALAGAGVLLIGLILLLNSLGGDGGEEVAERNGNGETTGNASTSITATGGNSQSDDEGKRGEASSGTSRGTNDDEATGSSSSDSSSTALKQKIVQDNGELLWASPTSGPPLEIDYVPLACLTFISVRPAEMLATEEGPRVLQSLGPYFQSLRERWESESGVMLADIEQLIIGLHDIGDAFPRPSFVVRLSNPIAADDLRKRWNDPEPAVADGQEILLGEKWAYYLPPGKDNLFVMGHADDVQDVAQRQGAPPPPRSGMSSLFDKTDADRHFNLVFVPNDIGTKFFRDGRDLFFGDPAKLREPLEWFLGDSLKAVLFSAHFGESFYSELRITSQLGRKEEIVATELRDRLDEIPERVATYMAQRINPSVYWRRVAFEYPGMIRALHSNTRIQVEDGHAVINTVLPAVAAHNLVFGSEMTLVSQPGAAVAVAAAGGPQGPQTIDELLQTRTTMAFDQTSLEFAVRDIEQDAKDTYRDLPFPFAIKIIGDDLKLDGITRNQQIRDFDQQNQPIADILTALVMKANPVTTVQEPSEADQKLLWVVGPDPANSEQKIVLITTREAAQTKGYTLPELFQLTTPSDE